MADQGLSRSLRTFPPEVRNMIYVKCLHMKPGEVATKTPVLLLALRGDPKLYAEALRIFYSTNKIRLDIHTFQKLRVSLNISCLESIRNLTIDFNQNFNEYVRGPDFERFMMAQDSRVQLATNIRTLNFVACCWSPTNQTLIRPLIANYAGYFTQLRRLEVEVYLLKRPEENGPTLIDIINELFVYTKGILSAGGGNGCTWVWEETDGAPLEFSWKNVEDQRDETAELLSKGKLR